MLFFSFAPQGLSAVETTQASMATVTALEDTPSMAVVRRMGLGWNLGNTLEACGDWIKGGEVRNYETAWGNPETTQEIIDAVKAAGERYLPRLDSQTDEEYLSYLNRACFFNATARTADGYVGLIFRRAPLVRLPDAGLVRRQPHHHAAVTVQSAGVLGNPGVSGAWLESMSPAPPIQRTEPRAYKSTRASNLLGLPHPHGHRAIPTDWQSRGYLRRGHGPLFGHGRCA